MYGGICRPGWLTRSQPKPPHSFFLGHLKLMADITSLFPPDTHPQIFYTELARRYSLPGIWYLDFWPLGPAMVVVTAPEAALQVTTTRPFPVHPIQDRFLSLLLGPKVINTVSGPLWKQLHHVMAPSFSAANSRFLLPQAARHVMAYRAKLLQMANRREVVRVQDETAKLVFDMISDVILGFSLDAQGRGSPLLDDFARGMDMGNAKMTSWNPVTQLLASWKINTAKHRSSAYIRKELYTRYRLLQSETDIPSSKDARNVMDRMLLERFEASNGSREELDPDFVEVATSK